MLLQCQSNHILTLQECNQYTTLRVLITQNCTKSKFYLKGVLFVLYYCRHHLHLHLRLPLLPSYYSMILYLFFILIIRLNLDCYIYFSYFSNYCFFLSILRLPRISQSFGGSLVKQPSQIDQYFILYQQNYYIRLLIYFHFLFA